MRVAVANDHAACQAKSEVVALLKTLGHEVRDLGVDGPESVDYPDQAAAVGRLLAAGEADLGILLCGSGIGMSIAANKIHGVRAACVQDGLGASLAREHNDANVLCLGARLLGPAAIEDCVRRFLRASFAGGRHARRVEKIGLLEVEEGRAVGAQGEEKKEL